MQTKFNTPLIIAHRGGANLRPENSLPAFAHALDILADKGADIPYGLECDIQCSKDGKLLLHHDTALNPAQTRLDGVYLRPDQPAPIIAETDYAALLAYDIGRLDKNSAYGARRPNQQPIDGTKIPLFEEFCALVQKHEAQEAILIVELKTNLAPLADESLRLARTLDALLRTNETCRALRPQMIFISFDWRALLELRRLSPDYECGFLTVPFAIGDPTRPTPESKRARAIQQASKAGAAWLAQYDWRDARGKTYGEKILHAIHMAGGKKWFAHVRDVNDETQKLAQSLGLDIGIWTANDTEQIKEMAQREPFAIITDEPERARDIMRARKTAH